MNKEYKTFEELKEELGDKFEEFMYKANINLLDKVKQLETNRDEVLEMINTQVYDFESDIGMWKYYIEQIQEILERGKE